MGNPDWVIQREIPGFLGYLAQSDGTVLSLLRSSGRLDRSSASVRRTSESHGYLRIRLRVRPGEYVTKQLHSVIALAFHGQPADPSHVVAHLDGDKHNCTPGNLKWMSHQENCSHKEEHGTQARGDEHHSTKMTRAACYEAWRLRDEGTSIRAIARSFAVDPGTIRGLLRGRTANAVDALMDYIIDIDDPMCGIGLLVSD